MPLTGERKREWGRERYKANKERQLEYDREYRKAHREQILARSQEYHRKCRAEHPEISKEERRNKEFIIQQKVGKVCVKCCKETNPAKLLFHHIDPTTKLFQLSDYSSRSIQALTDEIAKCELVCRKCHARWHGKLHNNLQQKG